MDLKELIDSTRQQLDLTTPGPEPHGMAWGAGLGFVMQHQMRDQWCWAAVAVSISLYYTHNVTWMQCALVEDQLKPYQCLNCPTPQCNLPFSLDLALTRTGNLAGYTAGAVSCSDIKNEVSVGRPIATGMKGAGSVGHFLVLVDCVPGAGGECVIIRDPLYQDQWMPHDRFRQNYHGMAWRFTYFTRSA